jgi:hypothetical protein
MPGAAAAVRGIESLQKGEITVKTIQEYNQLGKTLNSKL